MWTGGFRAGYYYPVVTGVSGAANGGFQNEVGDLFHYTFMFSGPSSIGITKLAFLNANATSGTLKFRLGMYKADDDAKPGTLLIDAGTITKDTTATNTPVDSSGSPFTEVTLTAGVLYYGVTLCEATASANFFRGYTIASTSRGFRPLPYGAEGSLSTDTLDYVWRKVPLPVREGVSTGSLASSYSGSGYPEIDEMGDVFVNDKPPPQLWMYVNTVTA